MFKISTIIAAYNVEDYIDECIQCLLNQSLSLFEIIIVDDGSTDQTEFKLKKWEQDHENIKVIRQPNSGGPGSPRNNGLKHASGDYIHFMDPDDLLDNKYYEELFENIKEFDPEIALSSMKKFNSRREWMPKTFKKVELFKENHLTNLIKSPELIHNLSSTNKIFKKDFLLNNNLYFLTGGASEEIHFTTCCYYLAKKIYINKRVNYYWRRRESEGNNLSMSQQKSEFKSVKDRLSSHEAIDTFLQKHNLIQYRYIKDSRAILDFLRHGNKLLDFDKNEQKQFFNLINDYLVSIDTKAYNYLPEYARQYFLTRLFFLKNRLGYELVASSTTKHGFLPSSTIYKNGQPNVIFDLKYLEEKYGSDPLFPRNIDVPKRLINGQAILKKAILNNKTLLLDGYGYINYLNVTSKSRITVRVLLNQRKGENKLVIPAALKRSPELTSTISHDFCNFKVKIPFHKIQDTFSNQDQTIDITLEIVVDGILRTKRLSVDDLKKVKSKSPLLELYSTDKGNLSIKAK